MKIIFLTLILLLVSCQPSSVPDCALGQCDGDRTAANDLVDEAQFDGSETTRIPMPDPGERVAFTGAITSESEPFTLEAVAGAWLEIGIYSLGLPSPGLILSDENRFHRHTPTHEGGSVSRTILIPDDGEFTLQPYSNIARFNGVTASTNLPFVAYVERLEAPATTPLLHFGDEIHLIDLFGAPSIELLDPTHAGALALTLETTHEEQQIHLYYGDPQNLEIREARGEKVVVPTEAASAWIYIDYEHAHSDHGGIHLSFEPRSFLESGASQQRDISIIDHSVLRVSYEGVDVHELQITLSRDNEILADIPLYSRRIDWFVEEGAIYRIRATNPRDSPIDRFALLVESIEPEFLGNLSIAEPLEIDLSLPFDDQRDAYFLFEIEDDGAAFQAEITTDEAAPNIWINHWTQPLETVDDVWLSATTRAIQSGPVLETAVVAADPGVYLVRLERVHYNVGAQDIHLKLKLAEPPPPFSSSETLDLLPNQIAVLNQTNSRDEILALTISLDDQLLHGPLQMSKDDRFFFINPDEGSYDIHWQGPQTFKPIFPLVFSSIIDPEELGALQNGQTHTIDTTEYAPGSRYFWLDAADEFFLSASSEELTVYLHDLSDLVTPETRPYGRLSRALTPGKKLIELSNSSSQQVVAEVELTTQDMPRIFTSQSATELQGSTGLFIEDTLLVEECDSPTQIGVEVHIHHDPAQALAVRLTNPQGETRYLHDRNGPGGVANLHQLYPIDAPSHEALEPLIDVDDASGEWSLEVAKYSLRPGTLDSWSLLLWCD